MLLKKFLLGILFVSANFFAFDSHGYELKKHLLNKRFLKNLDWANESSIDKISEGWEVTDEEVFSNRKPLKKTSLDIEGFKFEASLRKFTDTENYEVILYSGPGDYEASPKNLSYCSDLISLFTHRLGKPQNIVDTSDSPTETIWSIDMAADWDVGDTRVRLNCAASVVFDGYIPLIILHFAHKDKIREVEDVAYLQCTRTKKGIKKFDEGDATEEPPFTLMVDPNKQTLISKDISLGKNVTYSEEKIIMKNEPEDKNLTAVFNLDRYTGNYQWEILSTEDNFLKGSGWRFWGECTKIEYKKKF